MTYQERKGPQDLSYRDKIWFKIQTHPDKNIVKILNKYDHGNISDNRFNIIYNYNPSHSRMVVKKEEVVMKQMINGNEKVRLKS